MNKLLLASCLLFSLIAVNACSVPNLESASCSEARNTVKRFYSVHFANESQPSGENAKQSFYLTQRLAAELSNSLADGKDYFTQTDNFPKAFRVGSCSSITDDVAIFQVVLLWRDDAGSDQSEVKVKTVRSGETWLIDSVAN